MNGPRSSDDKVFQAAGPDVENARGPNVDVNVLGTTCWLSSANQHISLIQSIDSLLLDTVLFVAWHSGRILVCWPANFPCHMLNL